ncbi:hypothetical protein B0H11DRAFT_2060801 [Mycena galericulata]|nr:hypothetical protein B0H11DRAFT_2060801 [Mycena galericulata]
MPPISAPIAKQPSMDLYGASTHANEKSPAYHAHAHDDDGDLQWSAPARSSHTHTACHATRLKRLLLPGLLLAVLALSGLLALSYLLGDADGVPDPAELIDGILQVKRAVTGTGSAGGSSGSSFTRRKLYLIVVFVGLFVVLVLAVMLSAWCCRGSFENPLCCPCYLCATCGGLACLECIACGLCAEGVEQA